jgi:hypothetical protein
MVVVRANLEFAADAVNRRRSARRTLRLSAQGSSSSGNTEILIHDISTNGVLLKTPGNLAVGEILTIDIPEATDARAVVEWKVDKFFGCRFVNPISQAAVSGCLLKADPQSAPADKCSMGDALRWIIFLTMVSWTPVVAVGLTFAH